MKTAAERKAGNEKFLRSLDVPVNPGLPLLEDDTAFRSPQAVAKRAVILLHVVFAGHDAPRREMLAHLTREGLSEELSARERAFLAELPSSTEQDQIDATWRAEALLALLWALGHIPELGLPTETCPSERILPLLPGLGESTDAFIAASRLRSREEILDALDLLYRIDWAMVEARIHDQPAPAGFRDGVVREWRWALEWLIDEESDWDEIPMDT